jgi:hypothetical protein
LARQHAAEEAVALQDARALVFELGGYAPVVKFDAMSAGVVLDQGETAYRFVGAWLRQQLATGWTEAEWCHVLTTDQRLLVRLSSRQLISLWWGSLVGLGVDLERQHVTLDYGDGRPRLLSGTAAPIIAVVGIARVYGVEALLAHPGLEPVRVVAS